METELVVLAWGCVLGFVHIMAAASAKVRQHGIAWDVGPRDHTPAPPGIMAGRLLRAQNNFLETFPIVIAAALIVVVAGRTDATTALGAWLWLGARLVYLPLYALGVPWVRSLAYGVSIAGIAMMLAPVLF